MSQDVMGHSFFEEGPGAVMVRSIDPVLDCRRCADATKVSAADVLDKLTAEAVSVLRADILTSYQTGQPAFRCVACGGPLYVSTLGMTRSGTSGGTSCFFVHHRTDAAIRCSMSRDTGCDPDEIDRIRFHGQQEGRRHRFLKQGLARMLKADPEFHDIGMERKVRYGSTWCRPDVKARRSDQELVCEVQLATPQLSTQRRRTDFYRAARHDLLWIIDADQADRHLTRQGFQDIVWAQGGYILGLDADNFAAAEVTGRAQVALFRIHQADGQLRYDRTQMDLGAAMAIVSQAIARGLPLVGQDSRTLVICDALRRCDIDGCELHMADLCRFLDFPNLAGRVRADIVYPVAIALLILLTGKAALAKLRHVDFLEACIRLRSMPGWITAIDHAAVVSPVAASLLARPACAAILDQQRMAQARVNPSPDLVTMWHPVLAHLFPAVFGGPNGICSQAK